MSRQALMRPMLALALLVLVVSPAAAAGPDNNFAAPLRGNEEVPAVETHAVGVATFKLNRAETEMQFKLNVANGEGITQAHIHCGPPGVNGPVVVFLFGLVPTGVDNNGTLNEGVITNANVIPRPDSAACPGGVANLGDVVAKMRTGGAYANVHTLDFPGGEIRGGI
ncbi:MAG TPA: CHRD domain-containing protein [Candidatus Limnocylindrales bacterium]|nr:CHRD domain-containing protein [Candidatus Limnocylindrales bacterium]